MRRQEAQWVGEKLRGINCRVVLNLGSGSKRFREVSKPYIDRDIFEPLARAGARVVHSDLQVGEGVDIGGDLFDPAVQAPLRALPAAALVACNIMWRLPEDSRRRFPEVLDSILPRGGTLVVPVPYSYPCHADPIDTL